MDLKPEIKNIPNFLAVVLHWVNSKERAGEHRFDDLNVGVHEGSWRFWFRGRWIATGARVSNIGWTEEDSPERIKSWLNGQLKNAIVTKCDEE